MGVMCAAGNKCCDLVCLWYSKISLSERIDKILENCESFVDVVDLYHCSIGLLPLGKNFCAVSLCIYCYKERLLSYRLLILLGTCCRMELEISRVLSLKCHKCISATFY